MAASLAVAKVCLRAGLWVKSAHSICLDLLLAVSSAVERVVTKADQWGGKWGFEKGSWLEQKLLVKIAVLMAGRNCS